VSVPAVPEGRKSTTESVITFTAAVSVTMSVGSVGSV
jgi:hypothetical protein